MSVAHFAEPGRLWKNGSLAWATVLSSVPPAEARPVAVRAERSAGTVLLRPRGCGQSFVTARQYPECRDSASVLRCLETRAEPPKRRRVRHAFTYSVPPAPFLLFPCTKPRTAESGRDKPFAGRGAPGKSYKIRTSFASYPEQPAGRFVPRTWNRCFQSPRPGFSEVILRHLAKSAAESRLSPTGLGGRSKSGFPEVVRDRPNLQPCCRTGLWV